jgi:subtilase family serine protease
MVIGQAPLATLIIYDGPGGGDSATDPQVLSVYVKEEDDDAVDLITESYAWALGNQAAIEAHTVHLLMSAEGITYMAASGDDQSTEEQQYWYPDCEPEVLLVGGTSATVDTAGNRESEVPWESGSGGWSTINLPFNHRPSWQKGRGVPAIYNLRLNPDVAGHASGNPQGSQGSHYFYYNGHLESGYIGTSFACPVFASGLAIAEEALIAQNKIPKDSGGHFRLGRLQDLIYQQNGNPLVWHDITKGSNGTLPNGLPSDASAGWDTCSGWGAVNWDGFVKAFPVGAYP